MSPAHKEKIAATRASQKALWAKQVIVINKKWRIERVDELNWGIIRKGYEKRPYFFGTLIDALLALPHKILDEEQMKSMKEILTAVKEVAETLERLRFTKFENLGDNKADA